MWLFYLALALAQDPAPSPQPGEATEAPAPAEADADAPGDEELGAPDEPSSEEAAPSEGSGTEVPLEEPQAVPAEADAVPEPLVEPEPAPAEADEDRRSEARMLYDQALDAWEWGHWEQAYTLASNAVALDPDDEPARLLQGFALSRVGDWESGVGVVRPLQDSDEVGAHARYWVRRHDRRWTRSDYAVAVGLLARHDRAASFPVWHSGLGLSVDVPVVKRLKFETPSTAAVSALTRLTVRADATTPMLYDDEVGLYGVALGAVPVYHVLSNSWSLHGGLGPLVHIGRGETWSGTFSGLFPGFRAIAGLDTRISRRVGIRMEANYDVQFGARRFLPGVSHGPVLRWALVFFS